MPVSSCECVGFCAFTPLQSAFKKKTDYASQQAFNNYNYFHRDDIFRGMVLAIYSKNALRINASMSSFKNTHAHVT